MSYIAFFFQGLSLSPQEAVRPQRLPLQPLPVAQPTDEFTGSALHAGET